jgi:hypothetical protein
MRRICVLIVLFLLTFSTAAQAGIDEMSSKGYRLTKDRAFYNSKSEQQYYLLFYTGSISDTNGKFLLVDTDLNILAETPYAYSLYTFCPNIQFCYFMSYQFSFLAKKIWRLDLDTQTSKSTLMDLYDPTLSNKEAEETLLKKFLKNRDEQEFIISAPPERFSRSGTFTGIQNAPSWMRYVSPLMLISTGFLIAFLAFLLLRQGAIALANHPNLEPDGENSSKKALTWTLRIVFSAITILYGIVLCIGVWMEAPAIYGIILMLILTANGFSFKKEPPKKNKEVPPEESAS